MVSGQVHRNHACPRSLGSVLGGGEAGSRAESSKKAQTGEVQNQDYRQSPKKEGEKRREASGSQGNLLLEDTGGETIRETVLQRSQNEQAGTDVRAFS